MNVAGTFNPEDGDDIVMCWVGHATNNFIRRIEGSKFIPLAPTLTQLLSSEVSQLLIL
jgi:hypothetical protein